MAHVSKTKAKEQRIRQFLTKFQIKFEMDDTAIDLRTMAENYPDGIIPSEDIADAMEAVIGAPPAARSSVDPKTLKLPKFEWVAIKDTGVNPIFQRDICPKHGASIESNFDQDKIIIPCAIKDPISHKCLLWDGDHTVQILIRQGWTHVPVWYTEADINDETSLEEAAKILTLKAGRSFLVINKTGKRPVDRYDAIMIKIECGEPESVAIKNIVNANKCFIKRKGDDPGYITHIEHLESSYNLVQTSSGIKGVYLSRALNFHRTTWPKVKIEGIMMLAMARLYQQTETQTGVLLPPAFDKELGDILKQLYGPAELVHDELGGLKAQFVKHFGSLAGHPEVVTAGLILTYNKHGKGGFKLAQPESTYPVL